MKNPQRMRLIQATDRFSNAADPDSARRARLDRLRREISSGGYRPDPARLAATLLRRG